MSGRVRQAPVPEVINGTWKIGKKLGFGSFGKIYLGSRDDSGLSHIKRSTTSPPEVAIKLEPVDAPHPQLLLEAKVCKRLQGAEGVPLVYGYGTEQGWNYMAIDYLGPSLEDLFQLCGRVFTFHTTALLALQMLQRVETLHSKGYLHRDLKPDNFLMGRTGSANQNIVHMIDFGLAKPFRGSRGQHIPYRDGKSLTGTARYASINTHLGIEQSRRDDVEGLAVVLIYFSKGQLPWQGLKAAPKKDRHEGIMRTKLQTTPEELCRGCPREFLAFLRHARGLEFSAKPDYPYLRQLLQDCLMGLSNARELSYVASTTASGSGFSTADASSSLLPPSRKTSRNSPKKLLKLGLAPSVPPPFQSHVVTSPLYEYQGLSARNSASKVVDINGTAWDTSILFDWQYMRHQRQMFLDSEHALIRCNRTRAAPPSPPVDAMPRPEKSKRGITVMEDQNLFPPTPKSVPAVSCAPGRAQSREGERTKVVSVIEKEQVSRIVIHRGEYDSSQKVSASTVKSPINNKLVVDGVHVQDSRPRVYLDVVPVKALPVHQSSGAPVVIRQTERRISRRATKDESWLLAEKPEKQMSSSSSSSVEVVKKPSHESVIPELIMSVERPSSNVGRRWRHHGMHSPTSNSKINDRRRSSGSKLRQETNRAYDGVRVLPNQVSILTGRATHDVTSSTGRLASPNSGVARVGTYDCSPAIDLGLSSILRTSVVHETVDSRHRWDHSAAPPPPPTSHEPISYREASHPRDSLLSPQYRLLSRATTGVRDVGRVSNPLSPHHKASLANPGTLTSSRSPPIVISTRDTSGRVDRSSFHPMLATALSRDRQGNSLNNRMVRSVVQA